MTPVLDAVHREELRAKALAATPGPWTAAPKEDGAEEVEITSPYPGLPREPLFIAQTFGMADECGSASANAAHIAANSPSTTLALLAYIAELEAGPKVRPLEWYGEPHWCFTDTPVGSYTVSIQTNTGKFQMGSHGRDRESTADFDTVELAKAAAQADYESRILAALLPKASVREERK